NDPGYPHNHEGVLSQNGRSKPVSTGFLRRSLSLIIFLVLAVGLTAPDPAFAQQNAPKFGEGTHYLRYIIKTLKLRPCPQSQLELDMELRPQTVLLIVLGQT